MKKAEFDQESYASGEQQYVEVGDWYKCNRQRIQGSTYYGQKLVTAEENWKCTKKQYEEQNQGVVILVFKTKSCAEQVYEELIKMLGS